MVRCNSGFIQIQILTGVHRVRGCEKHWLPVPFETSSSWNQSTLDDGVHVVSVPEVVDVLGEVVRWQYIVLQCRSTRLPPECPWNCSEIQEMFGRIRVQAVLKPFLRSSFFCQESYPSTSCPLRSTIECCLVFFSARSSNLTVPSSTPGMVSSCRSNLIMNFETSKQPWLYVAGLMSVHFLPRMGIETGDNVTAGFGRGLAFATSLPRFQ